MISYVVWGRGKVNEKHPLLVLSSRSTDKDKITGEYLTGCAWSIDRSPVEGWRTCQHRMYEAQKGGMIHSYTVTECPEFEEG